MRILAIDPGYQRLGIAVIEGGNGARENLVYSECFETEKSVAHADRVASVSVKIRDVIKKYKPSAVATETLLFSANAKTAIKVAEVRGVILAEASLSKIPVFEYNPMTVKVAVTGYGKSNKDQVMFMTKKILGVDKQALDDEYDAMAIGITCLASERNI
jgi:crossover junction endodeoxyribonuclease RuvC